MFTIRRAQLRPHGRRQMLRCHIESLETRRLYQGTPTPYTAVNLVSDGSLPAAFTDTALVNPWGLASSASGPFWVANNRTGTSSVYNSNGVAQQAPITIPTSTALATQTQTPTGVVFNNVTTSTSFPINVNGQTVLPDFIFATQQGTIAAFSTTSGQSAATTVVDNTGTNAEYMGLASGTSNNAQFLYATDFRNNRIDVFNSNFTNTPLVRNPFRDRGLPGGYAPFGVANINGQIYVSFAQQNSGRTDVVTGSGKGFIDVFNTDGTFVRRLVSQGQLNAPYGMVVAPSNFGQFSGDLLVANFGNGRINAYNPTTGAFIGTLHDTQNNPIVINGLRSLAFGNGSAAGATNSLFFTAGPGNQQHGIFGTIGVDNTTGTTSGGTGTTGTGGTTGATGTGGTTPSPTPTPVAPNPPILGAPVNGVVSAPVNGVIGAPVNGVISAPSTSLLGGTATTVVVR